MTDPHLELKGITQHFGKAIILDSVDWALHRGQVSVLLGPNGAGKTTLLNIVAGAQIPTAGQLCYKGKVFTDLRHAHYREKVGYLTEYPYYYPFLTVAETFQLTAKLRGLKPGEVQPAIDHWVRFLVYSRICPREWMYYPKGPAKE